jgi:hypothetical protein
MTVLVLSPCAPRTAEGGSGGRLRPLERALEQSKEDELAIFGPILSAEAQAAKAVIKALGKPPKNKERGSKVWPAIITADTTIMGAKQIINTTYSELLTKEKKDYENDHSVWVAGTAFDAFDGLLSGNPLDSRYKDMSKAGVLSFSSPASFDVSFDEMNPGFNGEIDYLKSYDNMMKGIRGYAKGLLKDNDAQTSDIVITDISTLTDILTLKNSPFALIGALDLASGSANKYREALQIRNRMNLFTAQEVAELRVNIASQMDADAKFALARQQIRTNRHAAFKRSVGIWNDTGSTASY